MQWSTDVAAESGAVPVPLWTVDARNEEGALTRGTYGNGIQTLRSYAPETARLETLEQTDGGVLSSLKYDYYADGRVRHRTERQRGDGIGQRQETYVYDELHPLRSWTLQAAAGTRVTEYAFDDLGNLTRTLVGGVEQERSEYHDPRPHAISANRDGGFAHDARGRMRAGPGRAIEYTDFDLPRQITTSAGVTRFAYDAFGARIRKEGPSGTTITIAGLYERREAEGETQHVFLVPGSDGLVAQVVQKDSGERERQYLHQDALGSVTLVTDAHGGVVARRYYEPFGKRIGGDGGAPTEPAGALRLGLTGHEVDDELGLINMRGRVFDPQLKRTLTPDPYVSAPWFGQAYNRYSYVLNDPVNWIDPTHRRRRCGGRAGCRRVGRSGHRGGGERRGGGGECHPGAVAGVGR